MMQIVNMSTFIRLIYFQPPNAISKYKKMDDSIDSKLKPLHSTNIWTNNINNDINYPHPTTLVTNTINIEHYDLQSNFII